MVERIQKVVFMRHAVARHNVIDPATGKQPSLTDASLLDPPLVTEGKIQAVIAGDAIQTWGRNNTTTQAREQQQMNHLLIVTSPLTRCIQTATLAFLPGHDYERQLKPLTIVCKEDTREAHGGGHYPDKRREKSVLQVRTSILEFYCQKNNFLLRSILARASRTCTQHFSTCSRLTLTHTVETLAQRSF